MIHYVTYSLYFSEVSQRYQRENYIAEVPIHIARGAVQQIEVASDWPRHSQPRRVVNNSPSGSIRTQSLYTRQVTAKPNQQLLRMTDTKPGSGDKEAADNNTENLDSVSINSDTNIMEDKNDMFVSALDSPTDSGLAGLETLDISANNEESTKTPTSDTMEDLSLQVPASY